jgi:SAM-dependent methyltransferase
MTQEPTLTFTGERLIPGQVEPDLYYEHMTRYQYATLFSADKRVLDAGCGAGYGTEYLATNAATVIGIDSSIEAIRFARAKYIAPNLNFFAAACEALPFPDRSFDLIVSFEVIEHLADSAGYLREVARVLTPTGKLILSTPNKRQYSDAIPDYENPYHLHEFYSDEWHLLLADVFPHVRHIAQNYAQGLSFRGETVADPYPQSLQIEQVKGPDAQGGIVAQMEEAQFFVAVCSHAQLASLPPERLYLLSASNILAEKDRWIRALSGQVSAATAEVERANTIIQELQVNLEPTIAEVERANTIIQELQVSLAEQSAWGQRSAQTVIERDETIRQMQSELATLQQMQSELATLQQKVRGYEQQLGQRLRRQITRIPERFKKP